MRELTQEIRIKLKEKALLALQDGNALIVINEVELETYYKMLCEMYQTNDIEIN